MSDEPRSGFQRARRRRRRFAFAFAAVLALAAGAGVRMLGDATELPDPDATSASAVLHATLLGVTHAELAGDTLVSSLVVLTDPLEPATAFVFGLDPELGVIVAPDGAMTLRLGFARGGADGVGDAVENLLGLRIDEVAIVSEVSLVDAIPAAGLMISVPSDVREEGEVVTPAGTSTMRPTEAVAYLSGLFEVESRAEALRHQMAFWDALAGLGSDAITAIPARTPSFPTAVAATLARIAGARDAAFIPLPLQESSLGVAIDRLLYRAIAAEVPGAWTSASGPTQRPTVRLEGTSSRLAGAMTLLLGSGLEIVALEPTGGDVTTVVSTNDATLGGRIVDALGEGIVRPTTNLPPNVLAAITLGPSPTPQGERSL